MNLIQTNDHASQNSLSEATLLPMGKGFAITSNLNLGEMLLAGYSRHCTPPTQEEQPDQYPASALLPRINVAAITNDTVATLISLAYVFKPSPTSRVVPPAPRRVQHASDSRDERAERTAVRCAASVSAAIRGSPAACRTETDLGGL